MPPKKKKLCFVLMPFKDEMKEVYGKAIKPAAAEAGFECLRMDELIAQGSYNINRKIIHNIFISDAIVADLTDWNPNVFYEMGIAHTIANRTIMIIQKKDKPPFDVGGYHCIQYEQTEPGLKNLKDTLNQNLLRMQNWRQEPTNPVQEFGQPLVPRSELIELEKQLLEKEQNVTSLTKKWKTVEQELTHAKQELGRRPQQTEVLDLEKKVEQLELQLQQTKKELEKRPQQAEFLALKKEAEKLQFKLLEKEYIERNLCTELHQIKVTWDETDKKEAAEPKIIAPPGMVLIPAGEFIMGTSEEQIEKLIKKYPDLKREWLEWEKPAHKIWLDAFFMD